MQKKYKIAIFGASPDTPNMGVSALFVSLVSELCEAFSGNVSFLVFDFQRGYRRKDIQVGDKLISCEFFGARGGYKYYLPENLHTMLFFSKLGKFGRFFNRGIELIDTCDAVIDVSGGDSFSDIYGYKRFANILLPKLIAVNRFVPLILAPQTYGPFKSPLVLSQAKQAVKCASMVWARDEESFALLKTLLGDVFDPTIHLRGVDMAFKLPLQPALQELDSKTVSWIQESGQHPVIGFNISGLIYHDPEAARSHYGFKADYNHTVLAFIKKVLDETDCRILLIPHVMDVGGHYESDSLACQQVISQLSEDHQKRIGITPTHLNQSQVKWIISKMHWFCGTRMHSTIAAISSGVPTSSISYSDKTLGVFATCGLEANVHDPRVSVESEIVSRLFNDLANRANCQNLLKKTLPVTLERSKHQIEAIAKFIIEKK